MKKLDKSLLKQLILEEIGNPSRNLQPGKVFSPTLGSEYIQNYKNGKAPDNNTKEEQFARDPYETGDVETHIKKGEVYVTQGKNQFKLTFNNDDLTSGTVIPVGQHDFYIENGMIHWNDSAPANIRNDADLEKQIMDYSGREK